jgi:hypothetical protein
VPVTAGSVALAAPVRALGAWLAGTGELADGGVPGRAGTAAVGAWVPPLAVGPVTVAAVLVTVLVTVWTGPAGAGGLAGALAGAGGAGWLADAWLVADGPLPWVWLPAWSGLWVRP